MTRQAQHKEERRKKSCMYLRGNIDNDCLCQQRCQCNSSQSSSRLILIDIIIVVLIIQDDNENIIVAYRTAMHVVTPLAVITTLTEMF